MKLVNIKLKTYDDSTRSMEVDLDDFYRVDDEVNVEEVLKEWKGELSESLLKDRWDGSDLEFYQQKLEQDKRFQWHNIGIDEVVEMEY